MSNKRILHYLICALILIAGQMGQAQSIRPDAVGILNEAFRDDSSPDVPFLPYLRTNLSTFLFKPSDVEPADHSGIHLNKFVRTSLGLFSVIEGTGRVYKVVPASPSGYTFIRIDSTKHLGYNNGATVFAYRDTIFSLGGYGYWRYNGQLRYFNHQLAGWEIVPTNRMVQVREPEVGLFADEQHASVWFANRKNHFEGFTGPGLKKLPMEEHMVFRLDLKTKEWKTIGRTTDGFRTVADERDVICLSPWGPISLAGNAQKPKIILLDYSSNRILELKDPGLCLSIHLAVMRNGVELHRIATFFRNDSLLVLNDGKARGRFSLPKSVFVQSKEKIYEPAEPGFSIDLLQEYSWLLWLFSGLVAGTGLCYVVLMRSGRKSLPDPEREIFTIWEKRVLLEFVKKPDFILTVEEMDDILQTTDRSKDVQNQKRSAITRAVNSKYNLLTGDAENLIETRRQEFDRRMICYYLSEEKFAAIRDKVGKEAEGQ